VLITVLDSTGVDFHIHSWVGTNSSYICNKSCNFLIGNRLAVHHVTRAQWEVKLRMEQTASTYWKGINNQSQTSEKEFVLQYIDWAGCLQLYVYFHGWTAPSGPRPPHCPGFTITLRLWTRNETDAETSTWQFTTLTRDRRPWPQRDSNPQSQQGGNRRHTP